MTATTEDLTGRLDALLERATDPATRQHWERYLKGAASFRGVPMAGIRTAVRTLWREENLSNRSTPQLLSLAHRWLREPMTEDKLAATLLIAEHLHERLTVDDAEALARPLAQGHIADWNICDWYATKALHRFITADPTQLEARSRTIATWSTTPGLWQRRAAVVAFVKLVTQDPPPFTGFTDLLLDACTGNLVSDDRFAHTGPGWVLRELSKTAPDRVAGFVHDHPELSAEATRMATARLKSGPYRRR